MHDPSIGGPAKKRPGGPEKPLRQRWPELSAWHSPFCHMNELGSGIGLEGVLNTVWVKQIVPLSVDPGRCSNSSSQHAPPHPFLGGRSWRGALRSPCAPAVARQGSPPPPQNRLVSLAVQTGLPHQSLAPGRVGCRPPGLPPPGMNLNHRHGDRVAPARVASVTVTGLPGLPGCPTSVAAAGLPTPNLPGDRVVCQGCPPGLPPGCTRQGLPCQGYPTKKKP